MAMEVYLVPLGAARYGLYTEPASPSDDSDDEEERELDDAADELSGIARGGPGRWLRRWTHVALDRFRIILAKLDYHRTARPDGAERSWLRRLGDPAVRWFARKVAEQRLLWRMSRRKTVHAHYPADLPEADVVRQVRGILQRDAERHRFWAIFHGVAAAITGPLFFFVPGPNLVAYYFTFQLVAHVLSLRGARRGLGLVQWSYAPSDPLTTLRQALRLRREARSELVEAVEAELGLGHLAAFFTRMADRRA